MATLPRCKGSHKGAAEKDGWPPPDNHEPRPVAARPPGPIPGILLMNVRSPARTEAIAALDAVLPNGGLITADEDLARYSRDWSGDHYGRPLAVARPRSAEET